MAKVRIPAGVAIACMLRQRYTDTPARLILQVSVLRSDPDTHDRLFGAARKPWLQPPDPFALLILQAFSPGLSRSEFAAHGQPGFTPSQEFADGWNVALADFAAWFEKG